MGTLLRTALTWLNWISNHSTVQLPLEKMFSEKGGMIYTNIYPPKKLSINSVFLPSPEKQDLSDFLSQWYLKYKQIKTKNNRCFSTEKLFICAQLFIKKRCYKKSDYKSMLKTFLSKGTFFFPLTFSFWFVYFSVSLVSKKDKSRYVILLCYLWHFLLLISVLA